MNAAEFEVEIRPEDARAFAEVSGDWNPLHTDPAYAANTRYRIPILHGAFSAGLVSRMAGMHIPGRDCLLHSMQLKFLEPIVPPARVIVRGRLVSESGGNGIVEVTISDVVSGTRLVSASYEFGRHDASAHTTHAAAAPPHAATDDSVVVVTGASGGVGGALVRSLGGRAAAFSSTALALETPADALARLDHVLNGASISAIVHCGWPPPDNTRLIRLDDPGAAIAHHVAEPLAQSIALARLLAMRGTPHALLVLVGSTAADPGRHNFRSPLYSVSKSTLPILSRILAIELAGSGRRCINMVLDVVDGGMNDGMSAQARIAHKGRSPSGSIPSTDMVAAQVTWLLENPSSLISGATLSLSGGALP